MKFTNDDLIKAMGLSIGDRVKVEVSKNNWIDYIVVKYQNGDIALENPPKFDKAMVIVAFNLEYEILPRPKCVGELTCDEQSIVSCNNCPIKIICCHHNCDRCSTGDTLYEFLEAYKSGDENFYQGIYDLLKVRLDREVNNDE